MAIEAEQGGFFDSGNEREKIGKLVKSTHDWIKQRFDAEAATYIKMYKHEFGGIIPERFLRADRVDINVVYPIVKTLVPNLYFRDPKVFAKPQQPTITANILDEEGNQIIDPETGDPLKEEFDASKSALIFQSAQNENIKRAKLKRHIKSCIIDAHLTFYGVVKCGWGNNQGVATMGEGAPQSFREDIEDDMAYAIRIKPWDVVVWQKP